jgi:DnaA family protein
VYNASSPSIFRLTHVPVKQLAFDFSVAPPQTFDNFVPGRNLELVATLRALAGRSGDRSMYVWGPPGSGRTHLLRAARADFESRGIRTAFVRCDSTTRLNTELATPDALLLADVERLSEGGQGDLFNLYNAFRDKGGVFLAAGSVAPAQLPLRPDVLTRLGWGLVYEVHGLTDPEKAHALAEHAAIRGFTLHADVAAYLLTRVQRDLPTLFAMVDAVDRYSLAAKRAVTVPLVRELLAEVRDESA